MTMTKSGAALASLMAAALLIMPLRQAAAADASSYVVNPGDLLDISVWKEEELQREVRVLPDGTISFPLAGQMDVRGHTVGQVQETILNRIKAYIPDAAVTVAVREAAGNKVFVLGQVQRPGEYAMNQRVSIMQALSMAGGLTAFAGESKIRVLRKQDGKEIALPFDYSDVKAGKSLDMDVQLLPGDVIVVPNDSLF